jgi:hypothetical protein
MVVDVVEQHHLHHPPELVVPVLLVEEVLKFQHLHPQLLVELQLQLHLYKVMMEDQHLLPLVLRLVLVVVEQVQQVVLPALVEKVGIQFYHHLLMEHQDLLHQIQYIDTLLVVVEEDLVILVVLVEVVLVVLLLQVHQELQTLVVVEEEELMQMVVLAVQESSLFNIQNKEVKAYGALRSNWLQ